MKRFVFLICIFLLIISLCGCTKDLYYNSFDDYVGQISKHNAGYSIYELDTLGYFLPSNTFINDFEFENAEYYFYEEDPIKIKKDKPCVSLLVLNYNENEYINAKNYTIEKIPSYNDKIYEYGNYKFYENSNFIDLKEIRNFPKHFTMVCYNDENHTLIFLGFYGSSGTLNEKYLNEADANWTSFVDDYFSEYYDFCEDNS